MRRKNPLPAVVVSRCSPVAELLTVTLAPAILAPFSSRIAPTIPPCVVCAAQLRAEATATTNQITMRFSVVRRIDPPRYSCDSMELPNPSLLGFSVPGGDFVLVNHPILHDELDMLKQLNVRQRIAFNRDHVGK